jgi:hypothetical protein
VAAENYQVPPASKPFWLLIFYFVFTAHANEAIVIPLHFIGITLYFTWE